MTLEGHNKGVMAVAWCKQDSDLLLSAGKDGRVLCWNPNDTRPVSNISEDSLIKTHEMKTHSFMYCSHPY